jgi:hypothetical protein
MKRESFEDAIRATLKTQKGEAMTTKHTPGPWKACRDICHFDTLSEVKSDTGLIVAEVGGIGVEDQAANTRLIAAAPELLEALQEIVTITDRKHDAWDRAKAAIAAAEGKVKP